MIARSSDRDAISAALSDLFDVLTLLQALQHVSGELKGDIDDDGLSSPGARLERLGQMTEHRLRAAMAALSRVV